MALLGQARETVTSLARAWGIGVLAATASVGDSLANGKPGLPSSSSPPWKA